MDNEGKKAQVFANPAGCKPKDRVYFIVDRSHVLTGGNQTVGRIPVGIHYECYNGRGDYTGIINVDTGRHAIESYFIAGRYLKKKG